MQTRAFIVGVIHGAFCIRFLASADSRQKALGIGDAPARRCMDATDSETRNKDFPNYTAIIHMQH